MDTRRRWLAATALACALCTTYAAASTAERSLEDAFWVCDFIATTRGTAVAPGETCAAVYEEVKATRFGGNFEELVTWWQVNKTDAHARMAELTAAAPVEPVASAPSEVFPGKPSRAARLFAVTRAYLSEFASVLRND